MRRPELPDGPDERALRRREGDQQLPTIDPGAVCVQDEVIAYIERRKAVGIERYGTVLQPNNGRDALRDAFEESVDLSQYLAQALIERDGELPGATEIYGGFERLRLECERRSIGLTIEWLPAEDESELAKTGREAFANITLHGPDVEASIYDDTIANAIRKACEALSG